MTVTPYEELQNYTSEAELRLMIEGIYGEARAFLESGNAEHIERLRALFSEMPDWFKEEG